MTLKALSLGLLVASGLVASSPVPATDANAPKTFNLKTVVTSGSTSKNNLYLVGYHTGAGTNDATLSPKKPATPSIYQNGTQIQFTYSQGFNTWLRMLSGPYATWDPVTIDSVFGPSQGGFYFNDTASSVDGLGKGLKWNPAYPYSAPPANTSGEFGGWYACDWSHNVPQLFWVVRYTNSNTTLIDTCSKVELVKA